MNDTTRLEVRPEVVDFLDRVRARLADLTDEEREELLGGLEADLSELVADGGSVAELGDPRAYADELRAAAGLEASAGGRRGPAGVRRPRRSSRERAVALLDGSRTRWDRWVAAGEARAQVWAVLVPLRPAWWVLRGWLAAQWIDMVTGPWEYLTLIPRFGDDVTGKLLLVGAVAGSVLMGLRRTWPASHSPASVLARVTLLGLNLFAVLALLVVSNEFPSSRVAHDYAHPFAMGRFGPSAPTAGLVSDGKVVRNVFAYDAEGNPLEGVQLYDQAGDPLAIEPEIAYRMRYGGRLPTIYPWRQGEEKAWNVYPLPVAYDGGGWQRSDRVWTRDEPPFLPQPPLVAVPPAVLPLPEPAEPQTERSGRQEAGDDR
jgi:hypothetical protein